ncbi:MAG: hypothetical protein JWN44_3526 [Myxococcales bacterium]|nr:hypothetical protein [Myxococcales bacterium]
MAPIGAESNRETLERVARELRRATAAALTERSFLVTTLDDCRVDLDRSLSLGEEQTSPIEVHALLLRAELVLRTWRRLQTGSFRALTGERACSTCERGTLIDVARKGRMTRFRGGEVEIPADFVIPTCNFCRAESLDATTAAQLDDALLAAYVRRK